jgi:hypothetical protein
MKEAPGSSETSVLTRATRRNNPEDYNERSPSLPAESAYNMKEGGLAGIPTAHMAIVAAEGVRDGQIMQQLNE